MADNEELEINQEALAQQQAKAQQADAQRQAIISQILTAEAVGRLDRVAMVRPQQAHAIQTLLIKQAQSGQIRQKITEQALVQLLEDIGEHGKAPVVQIARKKSNIDESESDDFDDL